MIYIEVIEQVQAIVSVRGASGLAELITNLRMLGGQGEARRICEVFLKLKAVGLTNGNSFHFPITQTEIGEPTGLSTVHVNRSIMELRKDGLITLEKGRCTIADLKGLEDAATFDPTYLHLRAEQNGAAELRPSNLPNGGGVRLEPRGSDRGSCALAEEPWGLAHQTRDFEP